MSSQAAKARMVPDIQNVFFPLIKARISTLMILGEWLDELKRLWSGREIRC
jgi:hypothetical protein